MDETPQYLLEDERRATRDLEQDDWEREQALDAPRHSRLPLGRETCLRIARERFMRHVPMHLGPWSCWPWSGEARSDYGCFRITQTWAMPAHRLAFAYLVGPIPAGHDLHHTCENRSCVNPGHLVPLTRAEHIRLHRPTPSHCPHGHEYNEKNTYRHPVRGYPVCRTCRNAAEKARRAAA